jgi:hypothetical protein
MGLGALSTTRLDIFASAISRLNLSRTAQKQQEKETACPSVIVMHREAANKFVASKRGGLKIMRGWRRRRLPLAWRSEKPIKQSFAIMLVVQSHDFLLRHWLKQAILEPGEARAHSTDSMSWGEGVSSFVPRSRESPVCHTAVRHPRRYPGQVFVGFARSSGSLTLSNALCPKPISCDSARSH